MVTPSPVGQAKGYGGMAVHAHRIRLLVGTGLSRRLPKWFVHDVPSAPSLEIVAHAHDCSEILRKAVELRPDAVLVDSEMSGLELFGWSGAEGRTGAGEQAMLLCLHAPTQTEASQHVLAAACAYVLSSAELNDVAQVIHDVHGLNCPRAPNANGVGRVEARKASPGLTDREREILAFVAREMTSKEIGGVLRISPRTVDAHRANLMKKLGTRTIGGLVRYTLEHGILDREPNP